MVKMKILAAIAFKNSKLELQFIGKEEKVKEQIKKINITKILISKL